MKLLFTLLMLLAFVSVGCTVKPVSAADLPGKYQLALPEDAIETLDLLANGECVQEIRLKGGQSYTARGKWRYDEKLRYLLLEGTRISVTPEWKLNPNLASIPSGGTGGLPISRTIGGAVKIGLGEDWAYKRLP